MELHMVSKLYQWSSKSAQNYRAWKRALEIGLSAKRKLGFVKGTVVRSATDENLAELWDTCNNMVICWIMGSVSESTARSIMFVGTASEIWQQLEKRFSLSDGSRKYKLNEDTYEITQSGSSVGEYYTKMKCVWEELDNINVLPVLAIVTPEISVFLAALNKQKEEQRLFQFLNGLEEHFSHQSSQILMIDPLPSVEVACSLLQQEESQRLLFKSSANIESLALLSKGIVKDKCSICGFKWHPPEKCGEAHVESGNISFTPQQFEQLLKSVQQMSQFNAEEEIDHHQFVAGLDNKEGNKYVKGSYGLWHHRLGHVSDVKMNQIHEISVSKSSHDNCLSCPMTKFTKLPYSISESHSSNVFELIHIDIWGSYKVSTHGKFRYFLTIVDDCSRGTWIYLLEQKSDSFEALKSFIKFVTTQFDKQIKIVRSDNALEFVKGQCGPYLASQGIVHQTSYVDRPQQNGRVKTKHRHILDTTRALRFHSKLPLKFWGDCVTTATFLINRLPSSVVGNVTPYEILLKKKLDYTSLRVFGCLAMVSNPLRTADKFDPRGVPCVFLGYPSNQKGYKFYNLLTKTTFVSRDVVFNETLFPFAENSTKKFLNPLPTTFSCYTQASNYWNDLSDDCIIPNNQNHTSPTVNPDSNSTIQTPSITVTETSSLPTAPIISPSVQIYLVNLLYHQEVFQDFVTALLVQKDLVNFKEAVADPGWCAAMDVELKALEENGTWELTVLLAGKKAIGSHWIFKTKLKADGTEERKKARLVVQGNRQRHGIDYQETFAHVAKMVTVRSLLAIAAVKGWFTCQMDVSNAFLHGDLFEEVYMKPPLGYIGKGHNVSADSKLDPQMVCKLKKSLYGLKQAPRQWFSKLSSVLLEFGYTQSKTDYSLFVKKEGTSFTVVLVYVDDLLITGNDESQINSLKAQLSLVFHMKDLGEYTKELLKERRVLNNKPYKLHMEPNLKLQADVGTPLQDPEVYRRFIGKLFYLTITRPDICYIVQLLSQFMQSSTSVHMQAVKHLLRYLLNSPRQGDLQQVIVFFWETLQLAGNPTKQVVVSRSSAEAEYRAMAMTCCEVTWLVNLFKDLGIKDMKPVELFCDNQAALYIVANPIFHARTKHIEVDCHYVRDQLKADKIKHTYVHTKSQLADVFTKVVSVDQHTKLVSKLGVSSSINSQLEGECTKDKG
ncbi:retrovirus-related pol polyprotein from transposon TNT 1-94 [Tanacetum coccineum]|uniref:Retrovirus-related pol polyprotein from transposon TNT 1-94 n=1 Tax=Tanacetum coccineum TaxID=301880 RepID=A0ABQ4Y9V6_9ASTR